jgi:hypothetical protein
MVRHAGVYDLTEDKQRFLDQICFMVFRLGITSGSGSV